MALLLPVTQAGKCQLLSSFITFPVIQQHLDSELHHHQITIILNPARKRTSQSISVFQTGIGVAASATLETEQHISHTKVALVDTIASLQGSYGEVFAASDMHELLKFMTFWTVMCLNLLVIQLIFKHIFLIVPQSSVVKYGLQCFTFSTT